MEKYKKQMTDTLMSLLAINSVQDKPQINAPFGKGCKDALDYFLDLCKNMGFKTKNVDGYVGWAEIGTGDKLFGILAHVDIVPIGQDWTYSPLGEIINDNERGEVIYGRGTEDDKGPLVASLFGLKSLLDEGLLPKMRIRIIVGCNEESGWECITHYLKTEEVPDMSFSPDSEFPVVNCEKGLCHIKMTFEKVEDVISFSGGERTNMVADRATLVIKDINDASLAACLKNCVKVKKVQEGYELSATGKSAHGSTPAKGENAIIKIISATKSYSDFFATCYEYFKSCDGSGLNINVKDDVSGTLSMNVGMVKSEGSSVSFFIDLRHPVTYQRNQIVDILKGFAPNTKIEVLNFHNPLYFAKDSLLVKSLLDAYNFVTGENATPLTLGGATYARAFPMSVAFGAAFPNDVSMAHQKDENVSVDKFVKSAEIYREAIKRLCF